MAAPRTLVANTTASFAAKEPLQSHLAYVFLLFGALGDVYRLHFVVTSLKIHRNWKNWTEECPRQISDSCWQLCEFILVPYFAFFKKHEKCNFILLLTLAVSCPSKLSYLWRIIRMIYSSFPKTPQDNIFWSPSARLEATSKFRSHFGFPRIPRPLRQSFLSKAAT